MAYLSTYIYMCEYTRIHKAHMYTYICACIYTQCHTAPHATSTYLKPQFLDQMILVKPNYCSKYLCAHRDIISDKYMYVQGIYTKPYYTCVYAYVYT